MNSAVIAGGLVIAATLASVPGASIAYAVPSRGPVAVPPRWWSGAPAPIPARAAIAATTAMSAGLLAGVTDRLATGAALVATAAMYVVLAVSDLRVHRLPHPLTAAAWTTAVLAVVGEVASRGDLAPAAEALVAAVVVVVLLFAVAVALPGQLGLGDVNLAGTIALSLAWSSWTIGVVGVLVGLALQSVLAAVALVAGAERNTRLPFGPALIAGWLITAVVAL